MLELVDIGVNLASRAFRRDRLQVLIRAREAGVVGMVVTGTSGMSSQVAAQLAAEHPGRLWATAGVHPHHAKDMDDQTLSTVEALLGQPQVVAVGECGLDFNRDFSPRPLQEQCFEAQLELATRVGKPIFLHQRDAHARFMEILRPWRPRLAGGVVHCFTSGAQELREVLDLDLHVGITGWICDERKGAELQSAVGMIPPHRLLLETDAPYLLPRTLRPRPARRRNEPAFLHEVLQAVATYTGRPAEQVAADSTAAARSLFGLVTP